MNIRLLFNRVVPPACLLCGARSTRSLCPGCLADLPWHRQPQCPQCALPTPDGQLCGACLQHPPAFDRTQAALTYAFPLDQMIPRLKYHGQLAIAPVLGECLAQALEHAPRPDRLIAMPLHAARIRERGFNHATEIARSVARQLGLPLDLDSCRRTRDTPPQMGLKYDARRRNVRGAFSCSGEVQEQRIALIDDVMTTGTSLDELAATLKLAGALEVSCWVVARTLAPGH
ncbi:MAG: ComF family protein [Gammaproteobacteria bacterium]|nr:ComF family protein [Gammaproteobacteria bacterium]MBU1409108.1 ComF family protein [Gammaproteobacteria bacterium]MBU1531004.1 ComF family protein [Gammaproteobacteria bacterium]